MMLNAKQAKTVITNTLANLQETWQLLFGSLLIFLIFLDWDIYSLWYFFFVSIRVSIYICGCIWERRLLNLYWISWVVTWSPPRCPNHAHLSTCLQSCQRCSAPCCSSGMTSPGIKSCSLKMQGRSWDSGWSWVYLPSLSSACCLLVALGHPLS